MGEALVRHLSSLKLSVKAFVRTLPDDCLEGVEYYLGELPHQIPDFHLSENKKVIVFHFASCLNTENEQQYDEVNLMGTKNLLEHLQGRIHTFIYGSSMSVYGQGPFERVGEENSKRPETALAKSRLKAEQAICEASQLESFNAYLMRPRFILGRRDRSTLPALEKMTKYPFRLGDEKQKFSFIGVDDYVSLMMGLVQKHLKDQGICEAYNVSYSKPLALERFLHHLSPKRAAAKIKLPIRLLIQILRVLSIKPKLKVQLQLVGLSQALSVDKLQRSLPDHFFQWQGKEEAILERLIKDYRGRDEK